MRVAARPRWRAWADGVAALLGVNLWVTLILVPGLFQHAFRRPAEALLAALPLVPLGVGLVRRHPVWQLLVYPAALLLPIAWSPRVVAGNVHGPWSFLVVAASLVGYLFAVSFFASFHEPPRPARTRSLAPRGAPGRPGGPSGPGGRAESEPIGRGRAPGRWRRRFRVYYGLSALSALIPAALLYAVNFDSENQVALRARYAGRVGSIAALLNLGVLGLWLGLYAWAFVGVLRRHRTGDPELLAELDALARGGRPGSKSGAEAAPRATPAEARRASSASRRSPRPAFYAWVILAIAAMGLLVVLRYR